MQTTCSTWGQVRSLSSTWGQVRSLSSTWGQVRSLSVGVECLHTNRHIEGSDPLCSYARVSSREGSIGFHGRSLRFYGTFIFSYSASIELQEASV